MKKESDIYFPDYLVSLSAYELTKTKRKVQAYNNFSPTGSTRQWLLIIVTAPRSQLGRLCACFCFYKGKCVKDLIRGLTLGYAPIDSFHGLSNL